jgi:hypothetical protein
MTTFTAFLTSIALVWLNMVSSAFAHDGHGIDGAHGHASDAWGLVLLGLTLAVAFWFHKRK